MLFGEKFKHTYALTDSGVAIARRGTFWTVVVNLVDMGGIMFLYLLMKQLMDHLSGEGDLPGIVPYAVGLVAFLAVSFFAHFKQYGATYSSVYGEVEAKRLSIAERLRRLPLSFFGRHELADLTEVLMGDVATLEHVWSHVLGYLYGAYISTAIVAVGLLAFDWRLALAALWGVPVAFALLFGTHRKVASKQSEVRIAGVRVAEGLQEMLENAREIRATNQEKRYLSGLFGMIDDHERKMVRTELMSGMFINAAAAIMRLGIASTVLVGASLIATGQIGFMTLFAFFLVVTRIYGPFDQALALIAEVFYSEVSATRLQSIYDEPIAGGKESFTPSGHDIALTDVSFGYDADTVLENVSFTAKEGEVTALVGPSGSGKSTCARLAARLWDADSGIIEVGGVDIQTVEPEVLLGDYSMVLQDVVLFDDSIMGNIRLGRRDATDEEVLAAARAANCDDFVSQLPQGYDTPIGENGARLSGGERQRISIARALLKDAPILLLDEATASLDVENETQVQQALSRLIADKTVLVIAHRMRTVENADKVVVLKEGRVVEQGTPAELRAREDGLFARMTRLQKLSEAWSI